MKGSLCLNSNYFKINKTLPFLFFLIVKQPNLAVLADFTLSLLYNIKLFRYIEFTLLSD